MRRLLTVLLCLLLAVTGALAEENADAVVLSLNLTMATDEELADAAAKIAAEQRARIKTTITLDTTETTLNKGKKLKLTATVAGLPEGSQQPKLNWSSSDKTVATVQNGNVTAVAAGEAIITCSIVLEDGVELVAECRVTVIVPVSSVTLEKKTVSMGVGESFQPAFKVQPQSASHQTLTFASSDEKVATVDAQGVITAVGPGKCTVTATSTDGSDKSATANVRVTPFEPEKTEYTITSKKGDTIRLKYYGRSLADLNITVTNSAFADVKKSIDRQDSEDFSHLVFEITPLKAGTLTINIADKADANNKIALKVKIDDQAVYSQKSYPKIQYTNAFRYPNKYEGQNVSFTGTVLQVIDYGMYNAYRISSKGRYDDVVYVILYDVDQTVPLLEDDKVTVYGTYESTHTYEAINGATITIPQVYAERINLQKK